jgi:hypothetical protein
MKPESTLTTSTPLGVLNSEKDPGLTSDLPLPTSLLRSVLMNFTIAGEPWVFTLETDADGNLTSLTAAKPGVTCDCSIQLVAQSNGERTCCGPAGCTAGSC